MSAILTGVVCVHTLAFAGLLWAARHSVMRIEPGDDPEGWQACKVPTEPSATPEPGRR